MTRTTLGAAVSTDTAFGGTALGAIASTTTYDASALGATLSTNRWPPWWAADFEAGVDGNTVGTGDTGSNTAWDAVVGTVGAGDGVRAYSSTQKRETLSLKCQTDATSQTIYCRADNAGLSTTHYGRFYLYAPYLTGSGWQPIRLLNGTALVGFILIASTGKLTLADSSSADKGTTTAAHTESSWVRIEYKIVHSATVGQMELKLFNTPDSTTPTETLTTAATLNTNTQTTRTRFGFATAPGASKGPCYFDDFACYYTVGYPGPSA